ncbi:hypothetical protein A5677_17040 [Mycobacterium malmoense]|uniref:Uncharacterized protein n=1 Tax=Mycobacterium malmoense TaxID=1780 RepID=A0A1B9DAC4_MYCMA|nr:hypothetical protein [Mycobacterium malmoense]OCB57669.1 hypothetical protein A5677_17040 [Mycobacterium malmoense]
MSDDFIHQFGIRMPNGQLYRNVVTPQPVEDFSIPSAYRDVLGFFGVTGSAQPAQMVVESGPAIFPSRGEAEKKLAEIAKQAEMFGVNLYGGTVVERLCTPFTSNDPAVQFGREIAEWALKQGDNL